MDRPSRRRRFLLPAFLLLLTGAWFVAGISWGLPSRAADPYLFGDRTPWTGAEIIALTVGDNAGASGAADVDVNPVDRSRTTVVNATDRQRAEIVRRYRLYSYQPDEMNTFMALKGMKPGALDLDPKLYKYGGLWVYPVGAILKLGSVVGLIDLRADLAHYLDHPDAFARFYVAARLYTVAWALVGVWAVFFIARTMTRNTVAATVAALCFAAMPAVVNAAHEAKPHLPGVVLVLLAVMTGALFVRRGCTRSAVGLGVVCGAALGMVPSMLPALLIIPVAAMLRPDGARRQIATTAVAGAVALVVYAITNPYVPINFFRQRELLKSHFDNSADFYQFGGWGEAIPNAVKLLAAGMSPVLAAVGVVAAVAVLIRAGRLVILRYSEGPLSDGATGAENERSFGVPQDDKRADPDRSPRVLAILLAAPALIALVQFVAFAAGQPGDYGRFALLPGVALMLAAVCMLGRGAMLSQLRLFGLGAMLLTTLAAGAIYVAGFVRDAGPHATRLQFAAELEAIRGRGFAGLAAPIEPAPFSLPPVDLWRWRIELPPRGAAPGTPVDGIAIRPLDAPGDTWLHQWLAPRLSWASKSFAIDFEVAVPTPSPSTSPERK